MRYSKEKMAGINSRKRPYGLLLLLALAMAATCAVVLHQLREGRELGLLLQERDRQLLSFQILLQKERENSKEMKRKFYDMKAKIFTLRNQKMELTDKLTESRNTVAQIKNLKTELEAALVEKQIQVDKLTDKTEEFNSINLKFENLTSLLRQKEAEVEETKRSLARQDLAVNSTARNENSQHESFSIGEERRGEWAKLQTEKDEVGLNAENVSSMDQKEAQKILQYTLKNQSLGFKEMNVTEGGKGEENTSEEMEYQMKENESNRTESTVKDIVRDDRIIGSSSGQNRHDLAEKTQLAEVMKNFSIDNKSTEDFTSLKEEMEGNDKIRENRGKKYPEDKNDKPEDQKEKDDDNSEEAGESSSSNDLQLQEINSSESILSSQENGNGFTETLQKEADKGAETMGQSETVEDTEESETRRKSTDEKQEEHEGHPEKAENFEDKQNIFSSDTVERGNLNNFNEAKRYE